MKSAFFLLFRCLWLLGIPWSPSAIFPSTSWGYGAQTCPTIVYDGDSVPAIDYDSSAMSPGNDRDKRSVGSNRIFCSFAQFLAAKTAPTVGDHIVLGLERHGLQQTATQVGGRTLLNDVNWQTTLQTAVGNPSTRFTISLDGVSGSSAYSQFMNAAQRGVAPGATPFNWEMGQLYQAGRHVDATFIRELGTTVTPNPFGP